MDTIRASEVGVIGNAAGFHPANTGSSPVPRSKDRRIGRWAICIQCGGRFASFKRKGVWASHCSRACQGHSQALSEDQKLVQRAKKNPPRVRGQCACGAPLRSQGSKQCLACYRKRQRKQSEDRAANETIADWTSGNKSRHGYQKIRNNARLVIEREGRSTACVVCGYDKTFEVCHKTAIADYPKDTKISVVNHPDNLVLLCPNHHWEFDNKGLDVEDLK